MMHVELHSATERSLIELAGSLVATSGRFSAREADYRAQRDRMNVLLDAHRDADLIRLGYR